MRWYVPVLTGLCVVMVAAAGGKIPSSIVNKPWPAPVEKVPDAQPVVPALEALKQFSMAPGYRVELLASEPMVQDPILAEYDPDGRLWVMQMHGFAYNAKMENSFEPINDILILEDTNNDGAFDKSTVFIDKLIMPRAFKILDKTCALIGEPPNLIKACDTNGDLKADTRDILDKEFGTLGIVEHGANGLFWGMDNTIVVSEHTYNVKFENGAFKTAPSLRRGQWGVTQDNAGRIYRNVNTDPLFVDYVSPDYYARNPNLVRTEGLYESLVKQETTNIWPVRPTIGVNRGYRTDVRRPDNSSSYYESVSSPMIYRGDRLPKDVQSQPFVVDGATNIVHLLNMKNDSGNLSAVDFYPKGEFLASPDERFRPVSLVPSWDGTFLIIDMYRGVSQDGPLQTDYLKNYIIDRKLNEGINLGRIYRVAHETTRFDRKPQLSKERPAQLVTRLSHPNGWWRDWAQQLLVQRNDKSVVPALKKLAAGAPADYTRLHALWTLSGMGDVDQAVVLAALEDASPDVRASAVRLAEKWLREGDATVSAAVMKKVDDANWSVRRQLAASAGEMPAAQRTDAVVAVLAKYSDDQITVDAAVSGLAGQEAVVLQKEMTQTSVSEDALIQLAAAIGRKRTPEATNQLIDLAADTKYSEKARLAVITGAWAGLGTGQGQGGGVAGGRSGTFQAGRTGPVQTRVDLAAEPAKLVAMTKATGDIGEASQALLSLINWPTKPKLAAAAARTPAEEALFKEGQGIYTTMCEGCHAARGQGMPNTGAALAASKWVNGVPDIGVRILVNGKEGPIGLMPPAGMSMSDQEVAAILTFIRGSFGNTSTPISPAQVKEYRQAFSHRTTPWTEDELGVRQR